MKNVYPRNFSHIGISVPSLEKAVEFYTEIMGWYVIMPPTDVTEDKSAIGQMCTDVFGAGWESFRIAHLSTGDESESNFSSSKTRSTQTTILNTGKQESSISLFRTRILKSWSKRS